MREDDRVRIISGKYKGRTGIAIGCIPQTSQAKPVEEPIIDISKEEKKLLWAIQFDNGDETDILEESELEIIN